VTIETRPLRRIPSLPALAAEPEHLADGTRQSPLISWFDPSMIRCRHPALLRAAIVRQSITSSPVAWRAGSSVGPA